MRAWLHPADRAMARAVAPPNPSEAMTSIAAVTMRCFASEDSCAPTASPIDSSTPMCRTIETTRVGTALAPPGAPQGDLSALGLKYVVRRVRPPGALVHLSSFSFPSGHVVGTLTLCDQPARTAACQGTRRAAAAPAARPATTATAARLPADTARVCCCP